MSSKGKCLKCQTENEYTQVFCSFCGERLPWADAIVAQKNQAASSQLNEQERLAHRANTGLDKTGQARDKLAEAAKDYFNSPEFKSAAAKETIFWAKFGAYSIGCFGVCVFLLMLLFIVGAMNS